MNLITPDFGLLFWMVLIFGIVFFLLWKFGFPIITDVVEKRNARIENSITLAKEAEQRMKDLKKEQEALIVKTRQEQTKLLKEAAIMRKQIISQAREQAKKESAKILEKARLEITAEKESALKDIRREIALLSVDVAEKVVRKNLSSDQQQMQYLETLVDEVANTRSN